MMTVAVVRMSLIDDAIGGERRRQRLSSMGWKVRSRVLVMRKARVRRRRNRGEATVAKDGSLERSVAILDRACNSGRNDRDAASVKVATTSGRRFANAPGMIANAQVIMRLCRSMMLECGDLMRW